MFGLVFDWIIRIRNTLSMQRFAKGTCFFKCKFFTFLEEHGSGDKFLFFSVFFVVFFSLSRYSIKMKKKDFNSFISS